LPGTAQVERELISTAFAVIDAVKSKAAEIMSDGRLSDLGKRERVVD
jgi:hypothetical protein